MQPTTSSSSIIDSYLNSTEDCHFLLRALEKQAFENVVFAFRAQGPLTQYTELLLEHLKTALSINEEEFNIKIRMAANNPHICRIAQQLNPSYDTDARWASFGYDLTGIELAKIRKRVAANNDGNLLSKHFRALHKHNQTLPHAKESLSLLMQLPKRPYVPEKIRTFIRGFETKFDDRICVEEERKVSLPTTQNPLKKSVGRPRKRKRIEEEKRTKEEPLKKGQRGDSDRGRMGDPFGKEERGAEHSTHAIHQNVKGASFYKQRPTNSTKMSGSCPREFLTNESLAVETEGNRSNHLTPKFFALSADCPSSSCQLQLSQNPNAEPQNQIIREKPGYFSTQFGREGISDEIGAKSKEETHNERRANEERTFVCARVRPFNGNIQSKHQMTDKRPKRNFAPELEMPPKYSSLFRLSPGQAPLRMAKPQQKTDVPLKPCKNPLEDPNKAANLSHNSIESMSGTPSANSFPVVSSRFVVRLPQQNSIMFNAAVESDHAYEKPCPSLTDGTDGTNANVLPVLPVIADKLNAYNKTIGLVENGRIIGNGTCNKGILPIDHLTTSSTPNVTKTSELFTNHSLSTDGVVETSGLDFLASTASLLAPIGSCAVKCNDKFATTSNG